MNKPTQVESPMLCKYPQCPNKATHGVAGLPARACALHARHWHPEYVRIEAADKPADDLLERATRGETLR